MEGVPGSARGKLDRPKLKGEPPAWHPLADHCADVATCLEALRRPPVMARRLSALGGPARFDDRTVQRLGAIAFLHDIGEGISFAEMGEWVAKRAGFPLLAAVLSHHGTPWRPDEHGAPPPARG